MSESGRGSFDWLGHTCIALTLFFTVYGQMVLKWQMSEAGALPSAGSERLRFLLAQLLNPWTLSAFFAAFLASLAWMAAMTRFELSYAYPFMSLAFVIVMALGVAFLGEGMSAQKLAGTALVVGGLVIIARA